MKKSKGVKGWNGSLRGINASDWLSDVDALYDQPKRKKKRKRSDEEE